MSDKKPTSFEERLGRIAAGKPTAKDQTLPDPKLKESKRRVAAKALIAPIVAGAMVIGAVAYAAYWITSTNLPLRQMAWDALANVMPAATSTTRYDGLINSGPEELKMGYVGWEYPITHVALKKHQDLKVDTLLAPKTALSSLAVKAELRAVAVAVLRLVL